MEWSNLKEGNAMNKSKHILDSEEDVQEKAIFSSQAPLYIELRDVFDKQKLCLDPELNIKAVIKILRTNQKYLYQAISENSENNFRSFLNRYRVDEAKRIIEQKIRMKEELNLSDIFSSAGFNSPVSFYRAFKTVTGLTPKDYAVEFTIEIKKRSLSG
jgi:YesN/AraC family two-component response regulator